MTTRRPFGLPSARLIVIAAVAGIIAGAVAVYVTNTGSGNGADGLLAQSSGACEGAVEKVRSVSQFSKGQVAAMVAAQPPRPLNLTFKGPQGQDLKTADFVGRTVLLNL